MKNHCYIRVYDGNVNKIYDVGPFDYSGNEPFFQTESAINWIYKQIGLIKTKYPDSPLIKHKWCYVKDDFSGSKVDIRVEINNIMFETFNLLSPETHNVIDEQTTYEYPDWVKTENDDANENT